MSRVADKNTIEERERAVEIGNKKIKSTSTLVDAIDTTKQLKFDCAGITTGNLRTLVVPNENDTLALVSATQTLSNKTVDAGVITANNTVQFNSGQLPDFASVDVSGSTPEYNEISSLYAPSGWLKSDNIINTTTLTANGSWPNAGSSGVATLLSADVSSSVGTYQTKKYYLTADTDDIGMAKYRFPSILNSTSTNIPSCTFFLVYTNMITNPATNHFIFNCGFDLSSTLTTDRRVFTVQYSDPNDFLNRLQFFTTTALSIANGDISAAGAGKITTWRNGQPLSAGLFAKLAVVYEKDAPSVGSSRWTFYFADRPSATPFMQYTTASLWQSSASGNGFEVGFGQRPPSAVGVTDLQFGLMDFQFYESALSHTQLADIWDRVDARIGSVGSRAVGTVLTQTTYGIRAERKSEFTKTVAPTTGEDITDGYSVGSSEWFNTTDKSHYRMVSNGIWQGIKSSATAVRTLTLPDRTAFVPTSDADVSITMAATAAEHDVLTYHSGSWMPHQHYMVLGEVHFRNITPYALTMTTINVWYEVAPVNTTLESNNSKLMANAWASPANGRLQWLNSQSAIAHSATSLSVAFSSANQDYEFAVAINGATPLDKSIYTMRVPTANSSTSFASHCVVSLVANDYVSIWVRCTSASGTVASFNNVNLVAMTDVMLMDA